MLDTAVWAPNHRLTEPWRFFVLEQGSAALEHLAGMAHDFALQRSGNAQRVEPTRDSLLNTPVVIFMCSTPGRDEEGTRENCASVCCAAHNVALAGVAEGLAVTGETGGPTRHPGPEKDAGRGGRLGAGHLALHRLPRRRPSVPAHPCIQLRPVVGIAPSYGPYGLTRNRLQYPRMPGRQPETARPCSWSIAFEHDDLACRRGEPPFPFSR